MTWHKKSTPQTPILSLVEWWTRGYPHGVTVSVGDKELKLHVFPNNMKWPPTAKQIADAGLTPSEHALARRF